MLIAEAASAVGLNEIIATSIVTIGATAITGIIKLVPRRVLNGKGERLATKEQVQELENDVRDDHKYSHDQVDLLRNHMQTEMVKVAVLERRLDDGLAYAKSNALLAEKIDDLGEALQGLGKRQCELLESALKRTYKRDD